MNKSRISEVLLESSGQPELVRVLLKFWIPFKKYPETGVWSYLIKTDNGIIVFDVGAEKGFWIKRTKNVKLVIDTIEKFFPGLPIREIVLSHYHYDHAGGAPLLQKWSLEKWGYKPEIRIHVKDSEEKKMCKIKKTSLIKLFEKSGIKNWLLGKWLGDGEALQASDWIVKHTPGHTSGAVSLINERHKIIIGGWLNEEIENSLVRWVQRKFIDEDSDKFEQTRKEIGNLKRLGYTKYYLHPMFKKIN